MTRHQVEILIAPATTAAVTRFHITSHELPTIGEKMGPAFAAVMAQLGGAGIAPAGPALGYYEPSGDGYDVAAGFQVAEPFTPPPGVERLELGGIEVAHTTHVGPYAELHAAYEDLVQGADELGHELLQGAAMWEEYVSPPDTPEELAHTEIFWPVAA